MFSSSSRGRFLGHRQDPCHRFSHNPLPRWSVRKNYWPPGEKTDFSNLTASASTRTTTSGSPNRALQQVFKFSHDGKLLLTIGTERVAGVDATHFDKPTDIAFASDGSFYVSDGYGNNRVAKFSPDGKFLFDWGHKGQGPGEFDLPHSVQSTRKEMSTSQIAAMRASRVSIRTANS